MTIPTHLKTQRRSIPPDTDPVVQQALLNFALGGGIIIMDGRDVTEAALHAAERIVAEYETWLLAKRDREALSVEQHPQEERRERRITRRQS